MKIRITPERKKILDHMHNAHLVFDYTPAGNKMFFFTDGAEANTPVVERMIERGLLKYTASPLGGAWSGDRC